MEKIFVLLFIVTTFVYAGHMFEEEGDRQLDSPLEIPAALHCTPFADLMNLNKHQLPQSDAEWDKLFGKLETSGTDIFFSEANSHTELTGPRRLYFSRGDNKNNGTGGSYTGRLMVGIGKNDKGDRVAEFITAGRDGHHFFYGTVDPKGNPKIRIEAMNDCKKCHMTEGPLYTIYPWTNSGANIKNIIAAIYLLAETNPDKYNPIIKEIEATVQRVKKETEKIVAAGYESERADALLKAFLSNKVIMSAEHQGVPLLRNIGTIYDNANGAEFLHRTVEDSGHTLAFSQALDRITPAERVDLLTKAFAFEVTRTVDPLHPPTGGNAPLELPRSLAGKEIPALLSSLTYDFDHVKNKPTGEKYPKSSGLPQVFDFYVDLLKAPSVKVAIQPILAYNKSREKNDGKHPSIPLQVDPSKLAHRDDRGGNTDKPELRVDEKTSKVYAYPFSLVMGLDEKDPQKKKHIGTPFGLTAQDHEYMNNLILKLKADPKKAMDYVLKSKLITDLLKTGKIPSRPRMLSTMMKALGMYFSVKHNEESVSHIPMTDYLTKVEIDCLNSEGKSSGLGNACVRCHGSESAIFRYTNDLNLWKTKLAEGDVQAKRIFAYLIKSEMPPKNSPEGYHFADSDEGKKLKVFLTENTKK